MDKNRVSDYFNPIKPLLNELSIECENKNLTLRQALINFIFSIAEIDQCIFGVDNSQQLHEIIIDVLQSQSTPQISSGKYNCENLAMINPTNWRIGQKIQ
jgi:hypothetical protein